MELVSKSTASGLRSGLLGSAQNEARVKEKLYPRKTFREPAELAWRAEKILRRNDMGGWTKPAPALYPHQWSWDSALIALGLAHVDIDRGLRELETLFAAQWADG